MNARDWFIKTLREISEQPDMTQEKLGQKIGIRQSMVSRYLTYQAGDEDAPIPSLEVALKLSQLLGGDLRGRLEDASTEDLAEALASKLVSEGGKNSERCSAGDDRPHEWLIAHLEGLADLKRHENLVFDQPVFSLDAGSSECGEKKKAKLSDLATLAKKSELYDLTEGSFFGVRIKGSQLSPEFPDGSLLLMRKPVHAQKLPDGCFVLVQETKSGKRFFGNFAQTFEASKKSPTIWCWLKEDGKPKPLKWKFDHVTIAGVMLAEMRIP